MFILEIFLFYVNWTNLLYKVKFRIQICISFSYLNVMRALLIFLFPNPETPLSAHQPRSVDLCASGIDYSSLI